MTRAAPSSPPRLSPRVQLELGQEQKKSREKKLSFIGREGRGGGGSEWHQRVAWALPVPERAQRRQRGHTQGAEPCEQIKSSRFKQGLYKKSPLDVDFAGFVFVFFFPFLITLESADLTKSGRTLNKAEPDPSSHSPGKG